MAKRSEEHYKKIIQKQKKMIQELKKRAGKGDKEKRKFEALEEELMEHFLEEEEQEVDNDLVCPSCNKGSLELVDLKVRKMFICDNCDFRKIKK